MSVVSSLIPPLLSTFLVELGASNFEIGLVSGLGAITYTLVTPIIGIFSSRIKKKNLLYLSHLILSFSYILFSTVSSPLQLIPYNMLSTLSLAIFWPIIESMLPPASHSGVIVGSFGFSWSLGTLVGAAIAGFLVTFPKRLIFTALAVFPLLSTLLILILNTKYCDPNIRNTHDRETEHTNKNLRVITSILASGAIYASIVGVVFVFYPVYVVRKELEDWLISLVLSLFVLSRTIAFSLYTVIGRVLGKIIGPSLMIIGMLSLSSTNKFITLLSSLLSGFGTGITYSCAFETIAVSTSRLKGFYAGLFESGIGLGYLIGPLFGGAVAKKDPGDAFTYITILPFMLLMVNIFSIRNLHLVGNHEEDNDLV